MPDDVRQAKRIKWKIGGRASVGDGEEEYDLTFGFTTNKDDPDHPDPELVPMPVPEPAPEPALTAPKPALPASEEDNAGVVVAPTPRRLLPAPIVAPPSVIVAPSAPPLSSKKRSYNRDYRSSSSAERAEFMDSLRLSMMEQRAAREEDREERKAAREREERKAEQERVAREDHRKDLLNLVTAVVRGIAGIYNNNSNSNKKRKTRDDSDSD